ncbi:MAG TPA: serine/threonine-protein kinase [Gemmatimonadales bacterium]|nr:serine/threonine-protein kinase [Gemmatimonadales bacterium]
MNEPPKPFRDALAGHYAIEGELGAGGMAVVYLAHDAKHDRRVAIKVLRPEIGAGLGTERFVQEIRVAAQLHHPHILPLFDSGEAGGLLYYVAPYVEGESLRERLLRERQLTVPEALAIVRQVAGALAYAHARGIVHRDVKPENILLEGGEAIVADFGIALALRAAGGERMTAAGLALGTPTYISPEQASGGGAVDGRSDIYSLGCVLYELLAGEPPFSSPTPQAVLARHLHDTPPSLTVLRPNVPAAVARAVARSLEKAPADRFATATDFAVALEAPAAEAGRAWWRRRSVVVAALAVVAAVAVVGRLAFPGSAFASGQRALARWDLSGAQAAFRRAVGANPQAAAAQLWLAQTSALAGEPLDAWRGSARSAVVNAHSLPTSRDSVLAFALLALAEGRFPEACARYREALSRDSLDVIAWFGLGECQRRDHAVVRYAASPTGWRFRAGYQGAVTAYQRALDLAPALYAAFGAETYNRLSQVVMAERLSWRPGEAVPPDTGSFVAYPALDHDTLVLVPYPVGRTFPPLPATNAAAAARGAELLHGLVAKWIAAFPRSAPAHAALAKTLEMEGSLADDGSGRPTALDQIREAMRLERDPEERVALAVGDVRLQLKLGEFDVAARVADSLLTTASDPSPEIARQLACTAALLGRPARAADLLERMAADTTFGLLTLALPVKRAALRLMGFVALGAPTDSVRALGGRVDSLLRSWVDPAQRSTVRAALVNQLTPLPALGAAWDTSWVGWPGYFLYDVALLLARGDTAAARARLAAARRTQAGMSPGDLLPVPVYPEAQLFLVVRDTAAAEWLLDRLLDNLASAQTSLIAEPRLAGALAQAMVLRAHLGMRRHQPDVARRWAAAASALWRGADPDLRSTMHGLSAP